MTNIDTLSDVLFTMRDSDRIAIICQDDRITYQSLWNDGLKMMRGLMNAGVRKGDCVALDVGRTADYVRMLVGIVLCGAVGVTLDGSFPPKQREYIINDSKPVLLVDREMATSFRNNYEQTDSFDISEQLSKVCPNDPLWLIYSSGSTGTPKGSVISHKMMLLGCDASPENIRNNYIKEYCSRMLVDANFAYAGANYFLMFSLINRLTAVITTEEENRSLESLAKCIREKQADYTCRPQSWMLNAIKNPDYAEALKGMKVIDFGGEKNIDSTVCALQKIAGDAKVFLSYASSELLQIADAMWVPGQSDLLGKPLKDLKIVLLDEEGKPVAPGTSGEICVYGKRPELGRYWNSEELTDRKYVIHPEYGRVFHTGDRGMLDEEGRIHILDRVDNMIKLHGARIEPEYPERVIRNFPGIREAAVVASNDAREKVLCAYYTCDSETCSVDESELRIFLSGELPFYMIPTYFIRLNQMPLNGSGKLNRRELEQRPLDMSVQMIVESANSDSEKEELLCRIFEQVLKLPLSVRFKANDNFFKMGGNSIAGMESIFLLEKEGYTVKLKSLYVAPTPALLAKYIVPITNGKTGGKSKCMNEDIKLKECKVRCHELQKILGKEISAVYPVSYSIKRYLSAGDSWMMCVPYRVNRSISKEEWSNRIQRTVKNDENLRSVFVRQGEEYVRAVYADYELKPFFVDLSSKPGTQSLLSMDQKRYFDTLVTLLFGEFINPLDKVLFQAGLIKISENTSIVLFFVSHMLFDEIGTANLMRNILADDSETYEKTDRSVHTEDRNRALEYWKSVCPEAGVKMSLPNPVNDIMMIMRTCVCGEKGLRDNVVSYCEKEGVSLAAFMHIAVGRALAFMEKKDSVHFLTVCSGRNQENIRDTGLYVQSVPFAFSVNDTSMNVQEQLLQAQEHAWVLDDPEVFEPISKIFADGVFLDILDDYYSNGNGEYEMLAPGMLFSSEMKTNQYYNAVSAPPDGKLRIYVDRTLSELYRLEFVTDEVDPNFVEQFIGRLKMEMDALINSDSPKGEDIATVDDVTIIRDILDFGVNDLKDDDLFVFPELAKSISAYEFKEQVRAFGTWLYYQKIRNRRIALVGRNSPEWLLVIYAILCGENTAVMIDPDLNREDIKSRINQVNADILIGEDSIVEGFEGVFDVIRFSEVWDKVSEGKRLLNEGETDYDDGAPNPEYEAVILFTTGTTGAAKALALTHHQLVVSVRGMYKSVIAHKHGRMHVLITLPLYHIGAFSGMLLLYVLFAAEITLVSDYRQILPILERTNIQYATTVPRLADIFLAWIYAKKEKNEMEKVHFEEISLVGTTVSASYKSAFGQFGINVLDCYGMTESSGAILMDGTPIEGIEVKLDSEDNRGEILIKGPVVFKGYIDDEKTTGEVFENGWFHTGDIGTLREDGKYEVTGRLKNLIILSNGENVSPEELEERLETSKLIKESMVYASEDMLCADVVPETKGEAIEKDSPEAEEYLSKIKAEINLMNEKQPPYKRISKVNLCCEPLPRNALGKLIRK